MKECDAPLMLATDFPYQQFFPDQALTIHCPCVASSSDEGTRLHLGIVGDVKTTLPAPSSA